MQLKYINKKNTKDILLREDKFKLLQNKVVKEAENMLIAGDNLNVLKCLLFDLKLNHSVDLVYIDPPFATNNVFKIGTDRANTISSSRLDEVAYEDSLVGAEYIEFLRQRLILLRELMSIKASIYLHIDYKIGHYVKIIMDEIFGVKNFRNDITRIKCSPKNFSRRAYGNIKDLILFYTKSSRYTWNETRVPLLENDVEKLFKKRNNAGRQYTTVPLHAPGETNGGPTGKPWRGIEPPKGRHWRSAPVVLDKLDKDGLIEWSATGVPRKIIYADEAEKKGKKLQDIWEFKDPMYPEYPTEKNIDLLEMIIKTSSNEDDLVLDCFAGSGTTILAADKLKRRWIGIDQSEYAIKLIEKRLKKIESDLFRKKLGCKFYRLKNEK
jgi:adenine-specific DNA-methyltransferase